MSVKASELRIGNLILHMGEVVTVDAVDSDGSLNILADSTGNISSRCDVADPIPLTVEWLERMRFIKTEGYFWAWKSGDYFISVGVELDKILMGFDGSDREYAKSTLIKHLHQLQNLYFALTGEELTIKDVAQK